MAFVQPSLVPFSFNGGINSKSDTFQLQSPNLTDLKNGAFDKTGRLNKRFGYDILPRNINNGQTITSAVAIDNFNHELNLFDDQNIYTYIQANNDWASRGTAISVINKNQQIVRTAAAQQLNPEAAYLSGFQFFFYEDSRGPSVHYSILDQETGSYVISDQVLPGALAKPKAIVFNNLLYIFYTSNNNLYFSHLNPSNPLLSNEVLVSGDGYSDFVFDLSLYGSSIAVAFQSTAGASGAIQVCTVSTSNVVSAPFTAVASGAVINPALSSLALLSDSLSHLYLSYSTGIDLQYTVLSSPTATLLSPTLIDTGGFPAQTLIELAGSPGTAQLAYEVSASDPSNELVSSVTLKTDGTVSQIGTLRSVGLAGKAFSYNGNMFCPMVHSSKLQSTYFLPLLNQKTFGQVIGKVSPNVSGGLSSNGMLPSIPILSPGIFLFPNLIKGQFLSEDNTNFSLLGVNGTTIDFTSENKFNSVTQSNNLLIVGGILQSYDGVSVVEQNFHLYPEGLSPAVFPFGGALSVGQYQYLALYAWTDKYGQIQYSNTSETITIDSTTTTTSVQLTIPTLRLTSKPVGSVVIKVYRTVVNGTIFQEVTSELSPLLNDPSVDFVLFEDDVADFQMAANATVYTTGGVLPNSSPPSCSLISTYQDRVVLGGLEDPNTLWFSKNKVDASNFNTIPVEFSPFNTLSITQLGGGITAILTMDDKLIVFKRSSIYVLTGDGPNDTGGGNNFPPFELVSNSIGCTNANSIVLTKDGIMFQSVKGIWILNRGLQEPEYLGAGVDSVARLHQVSSAVVDPNDNHIIFTFYDAEACVYDYFNGQWSLYTNHQSTDSVVFNSTFCFVKENGQIYRQNRTSFADGSEFIPLAFTTPWFSFGQLIGYQRAFRAFLLGQFKGPHNLQIDVGYDFDSFFTDGYTIPATTIAGGNLFGGGTPFGSDDLFGGDYSPYIFQINFQRQACSSFRLRVSDNQPTTANEGYAISALTFEVGLLGGGIRLPLANKVGTI